MSASSSTEHAPGDGHDHRREALHAGGAAALTLGALGVVFGDIGTSPLYALQSVFSADHHAVHPTHNTVYGVISLVFWTITIIVSLKYVILIMRADNEGEGGIMALIAKIQAVAMGKGKRKHVLILLGIFGAALFYGDGMITPAISVLSAVEGMEIVSPSFEGWVVPITLAILTALFTIQRFGTGAVGRAFGPVMALWFSVLAISGLVETVQHPGIVRALSPTYALAFLGEHGGTAFIALGSVVLTVTGAEALYADMGHFGRAPIRRAWFALVFPALLLQYMGQGALLLRDPGAIESPFFLLMPHWARIPVVILATFATVIASQAVISGAFSVTRQAVRLGFLPRVTIRHTSREEVGQVYAPAINWGIFVAVVALVLGFQSSEHLASAYGIAVTGTLAIDTVLFFVVVHVAFGRSLRVAITGAVLFLLVDLTYFAANLPKVVHGGWFPLLIAAGFFIVLSTWQRGRQIITKNRTELEGPLRAFVEEVHAAQPPVYRAPRTGVFLNANRETTPLALRANLEHNHVVHESVVIVSVVVERVPHVREVQRASVDDLGYADDGIVHVTAHYGFMDDIDIPRMLRRTAKDMEGDVDLHDVSYFISRITILPTKAPGMARWRKRLFMVLARNTSNPVAYFGLPDDRTVVMGSHVEV
ncbi:MAG TPA: potassium transporter Kup [Baekduia sp.]|uniref:potassium transporter Kup n=1 Tax=Baekduia sp. TaxID=2600305 RepID=UPI002D79D10C|nr:potassium transporter Kup [Baekduia sp.]HET6508726.1 potassium transporter Kup [Baekduia sp.]